jgi:hypothetical protein
VVRPCIAGVLGAGYGTATKVDISTKSDLNDGTAIKTTFVRDAADKISAVLKASTSWNGFQLDATANGAGTIKTSAAMADVVDGVKLTFETSLAGGAKVADIATPTITADYEQGDVSASASVTGSTLDASATFSAGDICVGAATSYDSSAGSLGDPSLAASYTMGATSLTAGMNGLSGDDLTATVAHTVNEDLKVAGTFTSKDQKFALGAGYVLDSGSSIKAKVNSDGVLSVGYARKLTPKASLNAGLQVDTNDMDSRKFGIALNVA